jgi:hypothetical protein
VTSVAILGAGPLGGAIAHRLAERGRIREIRLIDEAGSVAAGKALDIRQAGPIGAYDTSIIGHSDPLAAAGADAIVFADTVADGEWEGERGLALVQRLIRAGSGGPFVFAGVRQIWLMEAAARELHLPPDRLIGTAAATAPHTAAALLHIEIGQSGARIGVTGRPPLFVSAWSAATIGDRLVTDSVPAHRLLAISQSLSRLWPPGPQAVAAPTALAVEALGPGRRAPLTVSVITDGEFGTRGVAALMPVELGRGRVLRRFVPSQSPQERTETANSLMRR